MMIDEICKFIKDYEGVEYSSESIEKFIKFKSIIVCMDDSNIWGVCTFAIHGDVIHVHDLVIHPSKRDGKLMKWFAIQALKMYPFLNEVAFERGIKFPEKEPRKYSIYRLIGIRRSNNG